MLLREREDLAGEATICVVLLTDFILPTVRSPPSSFCCFEADESAYSFLAEPCFLFPEDSVARPILSLA